VSRWPWCENQKPDRADGKTAGRQVPERTRKPGRPSLMPEGSCVETLNWPQVAARSRPFVCPANRGHGLGWKRHRRPLVVDAVEAGAVERLSDAPRRVRAARNVCDAERQRQDVKNRVHLDVTSATSSRCSILGSLVCSPNNGKKRVNSIATARATVLARSHPAMAKDLFFPRPAPSPGAQRQLPARGSSTTGAAPGSGAGTSEMGTDGQHRRWLYDQRAGRV